MGGLVKENCVVTARQGRAGSPLVLYPGIRESMYLSAISTEAK